MTEVVSVKVAYIRPKYRDLREWCEDKANVYIARGRIVIINGKRYPERDSIWANPFKITDKCTRKEAIREYKQYLIDLINRRKISIEKLMNLANKKLGCWCKEANKDVPCHGDVIVNLIKLIKSEEERYGGNFYKFIRKR